MNEVRRFLRYTLPGIAFVLQLLLALSISDFDKIKPLFQSQDAIQSLGIVIGGFLASGGVGYLFGILYFSLYWFPFIARVIAPNHHTLWKNLADYIEITHPDNKVIDPANLSLWEAWLLTTQYWFSRHDSQTTISALNPTIDRLTDVMHALGATFISTLFALITWIFIYFGVFQNSLNFLFMVELMIWIALLFAIASSRAPTVRAVQGLVNSTIAQDIREQFSEESGRIRIWFMC